MLHLFGCVEQLSSENSIFEKNEYVQLVKVTDLLENEGNFRIAYTVNFQKDDAIPMLKIVKLFFYMFKLSDHQLND